MAIKKVYAVKDAKAEHYMQPFFCVSEGIAARMFVAACTDEENDFHKFSEDFSLHFLGDFDQDTGMFIITGNPIQILTATEVVTQAQIRELHEAPTYERKEIA